jgi:Uma2 family endonuclease
MTVLEEQTAADMSALNYPELLTLELPYEDGEPLETNWHRAEINLLIDSLDQARPDHSNYFAGGNMFIYYSLDQVRNRDYKGPDFFVVLDVDGRADRKSWIVWEEDGRYPNVIVELLSASTATYDKNGKKSLYEKTFRTPEYYCYDPDAQDLMGWRLVDGHYIALESNENDWLWCAQLGVWLGAWTGEYLGIPGTWLRFYTKEGELIRTHKEAERQRTEAERQRAEAERQRAEAERQRAEAERQRADTLAQENQAMRALLRAAGIDPD